MRAFPAARNRRPARRRALSRRAGRKRAGMDINQLIADNGACLDAIRFIYGVRNFSSFALGLSAVKWERFLRLNFLAAGVWAATFVAVGFFLGHAFRAVLGDIARSFGLVMLGVFIAVWVGIWLLHRTQRRRRPLQVPAGAKVVTPPP